MTEQPQPAGQQQTQPETRESPPPEPGGDGLRDELDAAEERYKRALADLDNYRKRMARDLERLGEEAVDRAVVAWLEVIDTVERALRMDPHGALAEGLGAVRDQIDAVLARQGVERIGRPGEQFDPERHEAIGVVEDREHPDRSVLDVARAGFVRDGRVLRPAQVTVSRRPVDDQSAGG